MRREVVVVFEGRQHGLAREVRLRPQFDGVFLAGDFGRPGLSAGSRFPARGHGSQHAEPERSEDGGELLVGFDVVGRDEPGVRGVQSASEPCPAARCRVPDLEVVDVASQALGSFAVEDVGADLAFVGRGGRVGEHLFRVGERQVGEPAPGRSPGPGTTATGACRLPWPRPCWTGAASSVCGSALAQEPFRGVEPDGSAGRAVAAGGNVGDGHEREPADAEVGVDAGDRVDWHGLDVEGDLRGDECVSGFCLSRASPAATGPRCAGRRAGAAPGSSHGDVRAGACARRRRCWARNAGQQVEHGSGGRGGAVGPSAVLEQVDRLVAERKVSGLAQLPPVDLASPGVTVVMAQAATAAASTSVSAPGSAMMNSSR